MTEKLIQKYIAGVLSVVYFSMNVALSHAMETNVWSERRRQIDAAAQSQKNPQLASLPSLLPTTVPPSLQKISPVSARKRNPHLDSRLAALSLSEANFREMWSSPSHEFPPVILVQDVHLNNEAQEHIAKLLTQLGKEIRERYGRDALVGVEGAFTPFNFAPFRAFSDKARSLAVATHYLKENVIAAPSFVGIIASKPPRFTGIDDERYHADNVKAYLQSLKSKKSLQKQVASLQAAIQAQKKKLNPQLQEMDYLQTSYASGSLGLADYIRSLDKLLSRISSDEIEASRDLVVEQFLAACELEASIDFKRVEQEKTEALRRMSENASQTDLDQLAALALAHRSGELSYADFFDSLRTTLIKHKVPLERLPALDNYLRYIALADGINATKLFAALRSMERRAQNSFLKSDEEKALMERSRELVLAEKLIDFSLTPEDWQEYKQRFLSARESVDPRFDSLRQNLIPFEGFYTSADFRSSRMVENLLAATRDSKAPVAAMVIGGFHTPLISQYLRGRNISYAVTQPRLTKVDGDSGTEYLSIFSREKTPLEKLLAGERLNLAPTGVAAGAGTPATRSAERRVIVGNAATPQVGKIDFSDGGSVVATLGDKIPANIYVVGTDPISGVGIIKYLRSKPSIREAWFPTIALLFSLGFGSDLFGLLASSFLGGVVFSLVFHDNRDRAERFDPLKFFVRAMGATGIVVMAWAASDFFAQFGLESGKFNLSTASLPALIFFFCSLVIVAAILHAVWNRLLPQFELSMGSVPPPPSDLVGMRTFYHRFVRSPQGASLRPDSPETFTQMEKDAIQLYFYRGFNVPMQTSDEFWVTEKVIRAIQEFELEAFKKDIVDDVVGQTPLHQKVAEMQARTAKTQRRFAVLAEILQESQRRHVDEALAHLFTYRVPEQWEVGVESGEIIVQNQRVAYRFNLLVRPAQSDPEIPTVSTGPSSDEGITLATNVQPARPSIRIRGSSEDINKDYVAASKSAALRPFLLPGSPTKFEIDEDNAFRLYLIEAHGRSTIGNLPPARFSERVLSAIRDWEIERFRIAVQEGSSFTTVRVAHAAINIRLGALEIVYRAWARLSEKEKLPPEFPIVRLDLIAGEIQNRDFRADMNVARSAGSLGALMQATGAGALTQEERDAIWVLLAWANKVQFSGAIPVINVTSRVVAAIREFEVARFSNKVLRSPADETLQEARSRRNAMLQAIKDQYQRDNDALVAALASQVDVVAGVQIVRVVDQQYSVPIILTSTELADHQFRKAVNEGNFGTMATIITETKDEEIKKARLEEFETKLLPALPGLNDLEQLEIVVRLLPRIGHGPALTSLIAAVQGRMVDIVIQELSKDLTIEQADALLPYIPAVHPRRAEAMRMHDGVTASRRIRQARRRADIQRQDLAAVAVLVKTHPCRVAAERHLNTLEQRIARDQFDEAMREKDFDKMEKAMAKLPADEQVGARAALTSLAQEIVHNAEEASDIPDQILPYLPDDERAKAVSGRELLKAADNIEPRVANLSPLRRLRTFQAKFTKLMRRVRTAPADQILPPLTACLVMLRQADQWGLSKLLGLEAVHMDLKAKAVEAIKAVLLLTERAQTVSAFDEAVKKALAAFQLFRDEDLDQEFSIPTFDNVQAQIPFRRQVVFSRQADRPWSLLKEVSAQMMYGRPEASEVVNQVEALVKIPKGQIPQEDVLRALQKVRDLIYYLNGIANVGVASTRALTALNLLETALFELNISMAIPARAPPKKKAAVSRAGAKQPSLARPISRAKSAIKPSPGKRPGALPLPGPTKSKWKSRLLGALIVIVIIGSLIGPFINKFLPEKTAGPGERRPVGVAPEDVAGEVLPPVWNPDVAAPDVAQLNPEAGWMNAVDQQQTIRADMLDMSLRVLALTDGAHPADAYVAEIPQLPRARGGIPIQCAMAADGLHFMLDDGSSMPITEAMLTKARRTGYFEPPAGRRFVTLDLSNMTLVRENIGGKDTPVARFQPRVPVNINGITFNFPDIPWALDGRPVVDPNDPWSRPVFYSRAAQPPTALQKLEIDPRTGETVWEDAVTIPPGSNTAEFRHSNVETGNILIFIRPEEALEESIDDLARLKNRLELLEVLAESSDVAVAINEKGEIVARFGSHEDLPLLVFYRRNPDTLELTPYLPTDLTVDQSQLPDEIRIARMDGNAIALDNAGRPIGGNEIKFTLAGDLTLARAELNAKLALVRASGAWASRMVQEKPDLFSVYMVIKDEQTGDFAIIPSKNEFNLMLSIAGQTRKQLEQFGVSPEMIMFLNRDLQLPTLFADGKITEADTGRFLYVANESPLFEKTMLERHQWLETNGGDNVLAVQVSEDFKTRLRVFYANNARDVQDLAALQANEAHQTTAFGTQVNYADGQIKPKSHNKMEQFSQNNTWLISTTLGYEVDAAGEVTLHNDPVKLYERLNGPGSYNLIYVLADGTKARWFELSGSEVIAEVRDPIAGTRLYVGSEWLRINIEIQVAAMMDIMSREGRNHLDRQVISSTFQGAQGLAIPQASYNFNDVQRSEQARQAYMSRLRETARQVTDSNLPQKQKGERLNTLHNLMRQANQGVYYDDNGAPVVINASDADMVAYRQRLLRNVERQKDYEELLASGGVILTSNGLDYDKRSQLQQLYQSWGGSISDDGFQVFPDWVPADQAARADFLQVAQRLRQEVNRSLDRKPAQVEIVIDAPNSKLPAETAAAEYADYMQQLQETILKAKADMDAAEAKLAAAQTNKEISDARQEYYRLRLEYEILSRRKKDSENPSDPNAVNLLQYVRSDNPRNRGGELFFHVTIITPVSVALDKVKEEREDAVERASNLKQEREVEEKGGVIVRDSAAGSQFYVAGDPADAGFITLWSGRMEDLLTRLLNQERLFLNQLSGNLPGPERTRITAELDKVQDDIRRISRQQVFTYTDADGVVLVIEIKHGLASAELRVEEQERLVEAKESARQGLITGSVVTIPKNGGPSTITAAPDEMQLRQGELGRVIDAVHQEYDEVLKWLSAHDPNDPQFDDQYEKANTLARRIRESNSYSDADNIYSIENGIAGAEHQLLQLQREQLRPNERAIIEIDIRGVRTGRSIIWAKEVDRWKPVRLYESIERDSQGHPRVRISDIIGTEVVNGETVYATGGLIHIETFEIAQVHSPDGTTYVVSRPILRETRRFVVPAPTADNPDRMVEHWTRTTISYLNPNSDVVSSSVSVNGTREAGAPDEAIVMDQHPAITRQLELENGAPRVVEGNYVYSVNYGPGSGKLEGQRQIVHINPFTGVTVKTFYPIYGNNKGEVVIQTEPGVFEVRQYEGETVDMEGAPIGLVRETGTRINGGRIYVRTDSEGRFIHGYAVDDSGREVASFHHRPEVVNGKQMFGRVVIKGNQTTADLAKTPQGQRIIGARSYPDPAEKPLTVDPVLLFDKDFNVFDAAGRQLPPNGPFENPVSLAVETEDVFGNQVAPEFYGEEIPNWTIVEEVHTTLPDQEQLSEDEIYDQGRAVDEFGQEHAIISRLPDGRYLVAVTNPDSADKEKPIRVTYTADYANPAADAGTYNLDQTAISTTYLYERDYSLTHPESADWLIDPEADLPDPIKAISGMVPEKDSQKESLRGQIQYALRSVAEELKIPSTLTLVVTAVQIRDGGTTYAVRIKQDPFGRILLFYSNENMIVNTEWTKGNPTQGYEYAKGLVFSIQSDGAIITANELLKDLPDNDENQKTALNSDLVQALQDDGILSPDEEIYLSRISRYLIDEVSGKLVQIDARYVRNGDPLVRNWAVESAGFIRFIRWDRPGVPFGVTAGEIVVNIRTQEVVRNTYFKEHDPVQGRYVYEVINNESDPRYLPISPQYQNENPDLIVFNYLNNMVIEVHSGQGYAVASRDGFFLYTYHINEQAQPVEVEVIAADGSQVAVSVPYWDERHPDSSLYSKFQTRTWESPDGSVYILITEEITEGATESTTPLTSYLIKDGQLSAKILGEIGDPDAFVYVDLGKEETIGMDLYRKYYNSPSGSIANMIREAMDESTVRSVMKKISQEGKLVDFAQVNPQMKPSFSLLTWIMQKVLWLIGGAMLLLTSLGSLLKLRRMWRGIPPSRAQQVFGPRSPITTHLERNVVRRFEEVEHLGNQLVIPVTIQEEDRFGFVSNYFQWNGFTEDEANFIAARYQAGAISFKDDMLDPRLLQTVPPLTEAHAIHQINAGAVGTYIDIEGKQVQEHPYAPATIIHGLLRRGLISRAELRQAIRMRSQAMGETIEGAMLWNNVVETLIDQAQDNVLRRSLRKPRGTILSAAAQRACREAIDLLPLTPEANALRAMIGVVPGVARDYPMVTLDELGDAANTHSEFDVLVKDLILEKIIDPTINLMLSSSYGGVVLDDVRAEIRQSIIAEILPIIYKHPELIQQFKHNNDMTFNPDPMVRAIEPMTLSQLVLLHFVQLNPSQTHRSGKGMAAAEKAFLAAVNVDDLRSKLTSGPNAPLTEAQFDTAVAGARSGGIVDVGNLRTALTKPANPSATGELATKAEFEKLFKSPAAGTPERQRLDRAMRLAEASGSFDAKTFVDLFKTDFKADLKTTAADLRTQLVDSGLVDNEEMEEAEDRATMAGPYGRVINDAMLLSDNSLLTPKVRSQLAVIQLRDRYVSTLGLLTLTEFDAAVAASTESWGVDLAKLRDNIFGKMPVGGAATADVLTIIREDVFDRAAINPAAVEAMRQRLDRDGVVPVSLFDAHLAGATSGGVVDTRKLRNSLTKKAYYSIGQLSTMWPYTLYLVRRITAMVGERKSQGEILRMMDSINSIIIPLILDNINKKHKTLTSDRHVFLSPEESVILKIKDQLEKRAPIDGIIAGCNKVLEDNKIPSGLRSEILLMVSRAVQERDDRGEPRDSQVILDMVQGQLERAYDEDAPVIGKVLVGVHTALQTKIPASARMTAITPLLWDRPEFQNLIPMVRNSLLQSEQANEDPDVNAIISGIVLSDQKVVHQFIDLDLWDLFEFLQDRGELLEQVLFMDGEKTPKTLAELRALVEGSETTKDKITRALKEKTLELAALLYPEATAMDRGTLNKFSMRRWMVALSIAVLVGGLIAIWLGVLTSGWILAVAFLSVMLMIGSIRLPGVGLAAPYIRMARALGSLSGFWGMSPRQQTGYIVNAAIFVIAAGFLVYFEPDLFSVAVSLVIAIFTLLPIVWSGNFISRGEKLYFGSITGGAGLYVGGLMTYLLFGKLSEIDPFAIGFWVTLLLLILTIIPTLISIWHFNTAVRSYVVLNTSTWSDTFKSMVGWRSLNPSRGFIRMFASDRVSETEFRNSFAGISVAGFVVGSLIFFLTAPIWFWAFAIAFILSSVVLYRILLGVKRRVQQDVPDYREMLQTRWFREFQRVERTKMPLMTNGESVGQYFQRLTALLHRRYLISNEERRMIIAFLRGEPGGRFVRPRTAKAQEIFHEAFNAISQLKPAPDPVALLQASSTHIAIAGELFTHTFENCALLGTFNTRFWSGERTSLLGYVARTHPEEWRILVSRVGERVRDAHGREPAVLRDLVGIGETTDLYEMIYTRYSEEDLSNAERDLIVETLMDWMNEMRPNDQTALESMAQDRVEYHLLVSNERGSLRNIAYRAAAEEMSHRTSYFPELFRELSAKHAALFQLANEIRRRNPPVAEFTNQELYDRLMAARSAGNIVPGSSAEEFLNDMDALTRSERSEIVFVEFYRHFDEEVSLKVKSILPDAIIWAGFNFTMDAGGANVQSTALLNNFVGSLKGWAASLPAEAGPVSDFMVEMERHRTDLRSKGVAVDDLMREMNEWARTLSSNEVSAENFINQLRTTCIKLSIPGPVADDLVKAIDTWSLDLPSDPVRDDLLGRSPARATAAKPAIVGLIPELDKFSKANKNLTPADNEKFQHIVKWGQAFTDWQKKIEPGNEESNGERMIRLLSLLTVTPDKTMNDPINESPDTILSNANGIIGQYSSITQFVATVLTAPRGDFPLAVYGDGDGMFPLKHGAMGGSLWRFYGRTVDYDALVMAEYGQNAFRPFWATMNSQQRNPQLAAVNPKMVVWASLADAFFSTRLYSIAQVVWTSDVQRALRGYLLDYGKYMGIPQTIGPITPPGEDSQGLLMLQRSAARKGVYYTGTQIDYFTFRWGRPSLFAESLLGTEMRYSFNVTVFLMSRGSYSVFFNKNIPTPVKLVHLFLWMHYLVAPFALALLILLPALSPFSAFAFLKPFLFFVLGSFILMQAININNLNRHWREQGNFWVAIWLAVVDIMYALPMYVSLLPFFVRGIYMAANEMFSFIRTEKAAILAVLPDWERFYTFNMFQGTRFKIPFNSLIGFAGVISWSISFFTMTPYGPLIMIPYLMAAFAMIAGIYGFGVFRNHKGIKPYRIELVSAFLLFVGTLTWIMVGVLLIPMGVTGMISYAIVTAVLAFFLWRTGIIKDNGIWRIYWVFTMTLRTVPLNYYIRFAGTAIILQALLLVATTFGILPFLASLYLVPILSGIVSSIADWMDPDGKRSFYEAYKKAAEKKMLDAGLEPEVARTARVEAPKSLSDKLPARAEEADRNIAALRLARERAATAAEASGLGVGGVPNFQYDPVRKKTVTDQLNAWAAKEELRLQAAQPQSEQIRNRRRFGRGIIASAILFIAFNLGTFLGIGSVSAQAPPAAAVAADESVEETTEFLELFRTGENRPTPSLPTAFYIPPGTEIEYANPQHQFIIEKGVGTYDSALYVYKKVELGQMQDAREVLDIYASGWYGNMPLQAIPNVQNNRSFMPFDEKANYVFNFTTVQGRYTPDFLFWNTHTGPNAWLVIAALFYLENNGGLEDPNNANIVAMVDRIAQGMLRLQSSDGGMRYGPQNQFDPGQNENNDAAYYYFNTENNASAYAAFTALHRITGQRRWLDAAEGIIRFLTVTEMYRKDENGRWVSQFGLLNREDGTFYTGVRRNPVTKKNEIDNQETTGSEWATDSAGTWTLQALGPARFDREFGNGAAYKAYQTIRRRAGRKINFEPVGPDGVVTYIDFTDRINGRAIDSNSALHSNEWAAGFRFNIVGEVDYYTDHPSPDVPPSAIQGLIADYNSVSAGMERDPNAYAFGPGMEGWRKNEGVGFGWIPPWEPIPALASTYRRFKNDPFAWCRGEVTLTPQQVLEAKAEAAQAPAQFEEPVQGQSQERPQQAEAPAKQPDQVQQLNKPASWWLWVLGATGIGAVCILILWVHRQFKSAGEEEELVLMKELELDPAEKAELHMEHAEDEYSTAISLLPERLVNGKVVRQIVPKDLAHVPPTRLGDIQLHLMRAIHEISEAIEILKRLSQTPEVKQKTADAVAHKKRMEEIMAQVSPTFDAGDKGLNASILLLFSKGWEGAHSAYQWGIAILFVGAIVGVLAVRKWRGSIARRLLPRVDLILLARQVRRVLQRRNDQPAINTVNQLIQIEDLGVRRFGRVARSSIESRKLQEFFGVRERNVQSNTLPIVDWFYYLYALLADRPEALASLGDHLDATEPSSAEGRSDNLFVPAPAMSADALEQAINNFHELIDGKNFKVLLSGSNENILSSEQRDQLAVRGISVMRASQIKDEAELEKALIGSGASLSRLRVLAHKDAVLPDSFLEDLVKLGSRAESPISIDVLIMAALTAEAFTIRAGVTDLDGLLKFRRLVGSQA